MNTQRVNIKKFKDAKERSKVNRIINVSSVLNYDI